MDILKTMDALKPLCDGSDERNLFYESQELFKLLMERARTLTDITDRNVIKAAATAALCDNKYLADCDVELIDGTTDRITISLTEYPLTDGDEDIYWYCRDAEHFASLTLKSEDRVFTITKVLKFR